MGLKAPKGNENRDYVAQPNIEPGSYPARLVQIIDLGLQPQRPYQGQEKAPAHEIMLTYELVDCFMVDAEGNDIEDKPRWISETFPLHSLKSEKAKSTKRYLAFDPEQTYEGDWSQMIGEPIMVTVINNAVGDKIYDNIGNISPMRPKDAARCPDLVNPSKVFDLQEPNIEVFNALPEWLREKIKGNLEFSGSPLQQLLSNEKPKKEEKAPAKGRKQEPKAPVEEDEDLPY